MPQLLGGGSDSALGAAIALLGLAIWSLELLRPSPAEPLAAPGADEDDPAVRTSGVPAVRSCGVTADPARVHTEETTHA
ncbi:MULTISPECIES: hypothetical protein [unclassified Streptomyces]|uniref:hypothetical protein n=1 Tax=unclassified Streptomyces TaxID=2593676 RepID=UPI002E183D59|nr:MULTISPECIES: hypothetical protein [unclassified Streptomyces]